MACDAGPPLLVLAVTAAYFVVAFLFVVAITIDMRQAIAEVIHIGVPDLDIQSSAWALKHGLEKGLAKFSRVPMLSVS
jgi:hypothetical protein